MEQVAKKSIKVLVVGNPANTNAAMCSHYAKSIPKENFSAMTRLDHNRATSQVAQKCGVDVVDVKNIIIWGNHSSTQFPDASHAVVKGHPAPEVQMWFDLSKDELCMITSCDWIVFGSDKVRLAYGWMVKIQMFHRLRCRIFSGILSNHSFCIWMCKVGNHSVSKWDRSIIKWSYPASLCLFSTKIFWIIVDFCNIRI